MFDKTICVVGIGYVGLPCALLLAYNGCKVYGYDVDEKKVWAISQGKEKLEPELQDIFESKEVQSNFNVSTKLEKADIFIIAVPTPIDEVRKSADLTALKSAVANVSSVLQAGNLVIIESTVPPLTMRNVIMPILEENGINKDEIFLAHCPERLLPGNVVQEIVNNNRIIGGVTEESAKYAAEMYSIFVKGNISLTDDTTAEMCKLMENTYRDVNIALANELSEVCLELGIDVNSAIELANRHPRVNLLKPGIGVGGHCLPIDPWFIHEVSPYNSTLINAARHINDGRPQKIAAMIRRYVSSDISQKFILLGKTYKPETTDVRESPALEIYTTLKNEGYAVTAYDSIVDSGRKLSEEILGCNFVFVLVRHKKLMYELETCLEQMREAERKLPEVIMF